MYKNHSKYTGTLIWSVLGLVFGILPTLFWLFMLLACFVTGEMEIYVITFSLIFIALGVLFTVLGIRGLSTISVVSFCNSVFERDPDGIIEMDAILSRKGAKQGSSYERRVCRAVEKDYFLKLTYDRTYRVFELSDRVRNKEEYEKRFIGKNCPNCGAPLKIRKGMSAVCDKCGQEVKG